MLAAGVHPLLHRSGQQRAATTEHLRLRDGEVCTHTTRGAVGPRESVSIHECLLGDDDDDDTVSPISDPLCTLRMYV